MKELKSFERSLEFVRTFVDARELPLWMERASHIAAALVAYSDKSVKAAAAAFDKTNLTVCATHKEEADKIQFDMFSAVVGQILRNIGPPSMPEQMLELITAVEETDFNKTSNLSAAVRHLRTWLQPGNPQTRLEYLESFLEAQRNAKTDDTFWRSLSVLAKKSIAFLREVYENRLQKQEYFVALEEVAKCKSVKEALCLLVVHVNKFAEKCDQKDAIQLLPTIAEYFNKYIDAAVLDPHLGNAEEFKNIVADKVNLGSIGASDDSKGEGHDRGHAFVENACGCHRHQ